MNKLRAHWILLEREKLLIAFGGSFLSTATNLVYAVRIGDGCRWTGMSIAGDGFGVEGKWKAMYLRQKYGWKRILCSGYCRQFSTEFVPHVLVYMMAHWFELGDVHMLLCEYDGTGHAILESMALDNILHKFQRRH